MSTWKTEEEEEKKNKIKRRKEKNIKIDCRDTGFKGSSYTKQLAIGYFGVVTSGGVSS